MTKQCSIPRRLTMIRQNPVCLNRLGLLRKTGHNVRLTESPRVAKPIRDSFTVSNRLGRRQQTTGEVRVMSDSLSSAPRNQRRPNSRTLRSDSPTRAEDMGNQSPKGAWSAERCIRKAVPERGPSSDPVGLADATAEDEAATGTAFALRVN